MLSRLLRRTRLPAAEWLAEYEPRWLRADLVAGVTLAAYAVPVAMAYASLAGLPPQCGIYCYLVGGLAYALCGTCRQLAVGPTSAIAMLVGVTVADMAEGDLQRWGEIAALAAVVTAGCCGVAWMLRLSGITSFVSDTILLGFKAGAALTIATTQLPKFFGVPGGGEHFVERLAVLGGQLRDTDPMVLGTGLAALALLVLGERLLPGRPVALTVVVLGTAFVAWGGPLAAGIPTVGPLPAGLPELRLPSLRIRDVEGVVPLCAACFLLAYVEGVSAARTLAARHGREIDPRQELLALGAANLAAAFAQGFPVAGGLSQSAVNDRAGARTPLALVAASLTLAACLVFLSDLSRHLPNVVLAAVVLNAVRGLIDVAGLRRLRRASRSEYRIALTALAGVLLLGILQGVAFAAIASLVALLAHAARPHVAFLGRIPGTDRFSDLARHPENETLPGVVVFRVESSLLYFNVEHVRRAVRGRIGAVPDLALVVCDLSESPFLDVAGADMLTGLHAELAGRGVRLRIAGAHGSVRDLLRALHLDEQVGYLGRRLSVPQAIAEFRAEQTAAGRDGENRAATDGPAA
jgi:high affinity sulfate transporter 1